MATDKKYYIDKNGRLQPSRYSTFAEWQRDAAKFYIVSLMLKIFPNGF